MWTKGMIMVVAGIAGFVLTVIWIIVLMILSARKKSRTAAVQEEAIYVPGTASLGESPRRSVQGSEVKSTELLDSGKKVDTTVTLVNKAGGTIVDDTEILQDKADDTDVL